MMELITDKHIKIQALQHLLIHYENKHRKYKKQKRDDITKILNLHIAKIRRTLINVMDENDRNTSLPIDFY